MRPASYNRSRAQANRNNPANAAVYNDYSRYTERRSKRPGPVAIGVMADLISDNRRLLEDVQYRVRKMECERKETHS